MHSLQNLRSGATVEILDDSGQQVIYTTKVYRTGGTNSLILSIPIVGGEIKIIPQGVEYKMRCRLDHGIYEIPFTVIEYTFDGAIMGMLILTTGEIAHVQQRQLFRVDCDIPITCKWLNDPFGRGSFDGTITNLSGSGAKLRSSQPQILGGVLASELPLLNKVIPATASIVSVRESPANRNVIFCGVQFLHMARKDHDDIVQHVYHLQRARRIA